MASTNPRIICVTGCAAGIGLATAMRFASAGDTVVATARSLERADELRSAMKSAPDPSEILELDVTADSAEGVVHDVIRRHGRIDVLVNNAGLAVEGTLEDLSLAQLQRSLEVNFLGTARMTKAVLPSMRAAGAGHIIAVSSISGVRGMPFQEPYAAAKFALEGLFECTAPVAAMFGVHLSLVEPGPVSGGFVTNPSAVAVEPSEPYRAMYEAFVSMRTAAYDGCPSPDDVAAVIHDLTLQPDPPFRVQDTAATTRLIATKLADLDGSEIMKSKALFRPRER